MLQYNKLYQSLPKISAEWHGGTLLWNYTWNYFKFFENGTFIFARIASNDVNKIESNFNPESKHILSGTYSVTSNKLTVNFANNQLSGGLTENDSFLLYLEKDFNWEKYDIV